MQLLLSWDSYILKSKEYPLLQDESNPRRTVVGVSCETWHAAHAGSCLSTIQYRREYWRLGHGNKHETKIFFLSFSFTTIQSPMACPLNRPLLAYAQPCSVPSIGDTLPMAPPESRGREARFLAVSRTTANFFLCQRHAGDCHCKGQLSPEDSCLFARSK